MSSFTVSLAHRSIATDVVQMIANLSRNLYHAQIQILHPSIPALYTEISWVYTHLFHTLPNRRMKYNFKNSQKDKPCGLDNRVMLECCHYKEILFPNRFIGESQYCVRIRSFDSIHLATHPHHY